LAQSVGDRAAPTAGRFAAIVGPTAAGKTGLALDLAERLGAEIVNADSMALYRGMEIGTARTPEADRRGIVHHLVDLLDVTEEASVAAYQRQARAAIEGIWARGRTALLVGGSGLYVRAVTDVIEFPGTSAKLRAKWEALGQERGAPWLHAELARLDPAAASAILPGNLRRLARALEVLELTGRPFSATLPDFKAWRPVGIVGLDLANEELDRRIARRVDWMMRAGLVDEARSLAEVGLRRGRTASQAIGYREALEVVDELATPAQAEEQIALRTRQLARRQRKWFRRDPRVKWFAAGQDGEDGQDGQDGQAGEAGQGGRVDHAGPAGHARRAEMADRADQAGLTERVAAFLEAFFTDPQGSAGGAPTRGAPPGVEAQVVPESPT
jgi:tRNA dimethylallyltransferase